MKLLQARSIGGWNEAVHIPAKVVEHDLTACTCSHTRISHGPASSSRCKVLGCRCLTYSPSLRPQRAAIEVDNQ